MHNLVIVSTSPADARGEVVANVGCTCARWTTTVTAPDGATCLDEMIAMHETHADAALAHAASVMAKVTGSTGCTYTEEHVDWSTGERRVLSTRTVTV